MADAGDDSGMMASVWPDLAHLPVLLSVLLVAALTVGLGSLAGARRAETALIAGWGIGGLATVVVGTMSTTRLGPAMLALGVLGLAGLVRIALAATRRAPILCCGMFGRVVLLGLPLLAGIESMNASGWDDYSHWLPNLAYLSLQEHFPTLAVPAASVHAAYPYGLALPGFAVFLLLGQVAENAALVWNVLGIFAGAACIAAVLQARLPRGRPSVWAAAAIGVLLGGLACPSFVPKIALSNMADSASGSVLVVLASLVFDWWRATDRRARDGIAMTLGCCTIALINLRQTNFALFLLGLIGLALAAMLARGRPDAGWRALAIGVPPPLLAWALWSHYASVEIPGGAFVILPVADWHWADLGLTLLSVLRIMLAKTGLFAVILVIAARAGLALRRSDGLTPPQRAVLLVGVTVCVGNIGFLIFTYLAASFGAEESAAAASFWRYTGQTGPLAMLVLLAVIPLGWANPLFRLRGAWVMVGLTLLLPIATVRLYRHDLATPVPALRRMALEIEGLVPRGVPILLVDLTGNGFEPIVIAYQLRLMEQGEATRALAIVSSARGFSAGEAAQLSFAGAHYLWLTEGAPEMRGIFGIAVRAGCSYLLRADSNRDTILMSWQLPPSARPVNMSGWSLQRGESCS